MDDCLRNLAIYIVVLFGMQIGSVVGSIFLGPLVGLLSLLISVAVHFWFMFYVYNDAKQIGVSENWWLAIFLFSFIGGIAYWFMTKEQRAKTASMPTTA